MAAPGIEGRPQWRGLQGAGGKQLPFQFALKAFEVNEMKSMRAVMPYFVALTLTACGGGGGSSSPPAPAVDHSKDANGIWMVNTTAANGDPVQGAVVIVGATSFGESIDTTTGCETISYTNNVTTDSNDNVSASGMGVLNQAAALATVCQYQDGSTAGTFSDSGSVVPQSSLTFSHESFTTTGGTTTTDVGPVAQFSTLYNETSNLAALMGTYDLNQTGGAPLNLDSAGNMTYPVDGNGCSAVGTLALLDPNHAVYSITNIAFTNCGALSGSGYTGLALRDDTVSPPVLHLLFQGNQIVAHLPFVMQ